MLLIMTKHNRNLTMTIGNRGHFLWGTWHADTFLMLWSFAQNFARRLLLVFIFAAVGSSTCTDLQWWAPVFLFGFKGLDS